MQISVLAVGTRLPAWVNDGVKEYSRRMPRQIQFSLEEISPGHRSARGQIAAAREQEAVQLKKRATAADLRIALDEKGKPWTSTELADQLRDWLQHVPHVALMIGGPDGFTDEIRDEADRLWSLSNLTLPHGLVRVVLAEQIYRAWTIVDGHPYHREGR
jgi:23S rRNA (pseudouridine1915-N3)-methyltransferase